MIVRLTMIRTAVHFRSMLHHRPNIIVSFLLAAVLLSACGGDAKPDKSSDKAKGTAKAGAGTDSTVGASASADSAPAVIGFQSGEAVDANTGFQFRIAPHAGDVYSYRVVQSGWTEFSGLKSTERASYCFTQKITGINSDGSFTIEMRYDSISSTKTFPAGVVDSVPRTFSYDTRRKVDSTVPEAAQAKALIGQRVNLTISREGEVREVSNLEPVLSAVLGKLRDSLSPNGVEQIRRAIKVTMFEAVVQQMFLQTIPDSAIHVGSVWSRTDTVPLVLPIAAVPSRALVSYKLVEVKKVEGRTLGHIVVTLATQFPQKKMDNKQVTTTIDDASAKGTGDGLFDLASGFPVRKVAGFDVMLKVTGKAKVGPAAGKSQSLGQTKASSTVVEMLGHTAGE